MPITLRRCLRWICLTLIILGAPHLLAAQSPVASPTSHLLPQAASQPTLPDNDAGLLDHCIVQLPALPAYATQAGRGVHLFHALDEEVAPRLHRRVGKEAEPISFVPLPVAAALQMQVAQMDELSANDRPVGRAPPNS